MPHPLSSTGTRCRESFGGNKGDRREPFLQGTPGSGYRCGRRSSEYKARRKGYRCGIRARVTVLGRALQRSPVTPIIVVLVLLGACAPADNNHNVQIQALGTLVTLRYYDTDAATAEAATDALERLYRDYGRDWYPWYEPAGRSELARINRALAKGESAMASEELVSLLKRATDLEARSGGLFNVALGALTELWGFHEPLQQDWQPPPDAAIETILASRPGTGQLHWDGSRLTSSNRDIVIDPGGIAKGALLGMSVRVLREHGIENAIVDLGGDMTVLGQVHGRAARIGIRDPDGGAPIGRIEAVDGETVVTSGNYERFFEADGQRYAHVLDPRTGYPARNTASVTVIDTDPILADAAATALLVAGNAAFAEACERLGIDHALLISDRGDLRLTPQMRDRVHWRE